MSSLLQISGINTAIECNIDCKCVSLCADSIFGDLQQYLCVFCLRTIFLLSSGEAVWNLQQ